MFAQHGNPMHAYETHQINHYPARPFLVHQERGNNHERHDICVHPILCAITRDICLPIFCIHCLVGPDMVAHKHKEPA
jgi:hypothetical protein